MMYIDHAYDILATSHVPSLSRQEEMLRLVYFLWKIGH